MDQNTLRKLAGLPLLKEWKEVVDAPTNAKPEKKEDDENVDLKVDKGEDEGKGKDEKNDLPEIITKIALNVCKKFGIGDPDGKESNDLTAMQDFLKKVYDAGVADGSAAKDDLKEDEQNPTSVASVQATLKQFEGTGYEAGNVR